MSQLLDQAARDDPQRAQDLDRTDEEMFGSPLPQTEEERLIQYQGYIGELMQ